MSSSPQSKLAMAKTTISAVGSIAAAAMVARTVIRDYLPHEVQDYFYLGTRNLFNRFSNQLTMVIDEFDGLVTNEIYEAAEVYLATKITPNVHRLKVTKPEKEKNITATMERNEEVSDKYEGAKFKWIWVCQKVQSSSSFYNPHDMNSTLRSEVRSFQLTFHKKHKDMVLKFYLPHILKEAKSKKHENKTVKIFTISNHQVYSSYGASNPWTSISLDHPATFDTVAMDTKMKEMVMKDLENFVNRREKYRKVGKAWKRGYLLYGPPGTGKSSLIAAMANYLNFDIYDLELTDIRHNSELRRLLVGTANQSILVVEDIDCTIELQDRLTAVSHPRAQQLGFHPVENKVTLSGFLNFIDGLWSSCGDERIIVFTTNHKEKLDPALLRPGRMDLHIHMSYCSPCGFKVLAANYLGVKEHKLFGEIEELIRTTEVTPAEVAEQLLKSDDADETLGGLIDFQIVGGGLWAAMEVGDEVGDGDRRSEMKMEEWLVAIGYRRRQTFSGRPRCTILCHLCCCRRWWRWLEKWKTDEISDDKVLEFRDLAATTAFFSGSDRSAARISPTALVRRRTEKSSDRRPRVLDSSGSAVDDGRSGHRVRHGGCGD